MKKVFFLFSILALVALFSTCAKDGEQGPQGLQGEQGPAGDNGSIIYAGNGAPDNDAGIAGDFYLNKTTGDLYGPKSDDTGWGVPIVLKGNTGSKGDKGDTGEAGTDGSAIYAGTTAPELSTGKEGDYFLNTSSYDLYGPKTSSSWGVPINLKGTANVMYSAWIGADWNIQNHATLKGMSIPVNQLSNNVQRDRCLVVVYQKQYGTGQIYPMPGSGRWSNVWYQYSFGGTSSGFTQKIYITLVSTDGTDLTEYQYSAVRGNYFRYVLIPGEVLNPASINKQKENFAPNLMDYQETSKYFGLEN
ncbi:MAG: hypothetical protein JXB34_09265 [Bacteroidales bacterium]|nr:hypothetical protein [Bacteroidales bacterium]